jgi:hypothetical protein
MLVRKQYYARPLPQQNEGRSRNYTLQTRCEAIGRPIIGMGNEQVEGCKWQPESQSSVTCPAGYAKVASCSKTQQSHPDLLYETNIPYKPTFYEWNEYLGFIGYPPGLNRDQYQDGRHWPKSPDNGKICYTSGC